MTCTVLLTTTIGNRCDIFAFDIRQEATDRGFGVWCGGLTMEGCDKGLHKGGKTWDDLRDNLRGHLACFKPPVVLRPGAQH